MNASTLRLLALTAAGAGTEDHARATGALPLANEIERALTEVHNAALTEAAHVVAQSSTIDLKRDVSDRILRRFLPLPMKEKVP